jgi:hypothetical protein
VSVAEENQGRRRLDRILKPDYLDDLAGKSMDDIRTSRDECLAEREFLSYLRRLLQGRLEILVDERRARKTGEEPAPLVERLASIFAAETPIGPGRGEPLRLGVPEEEMLQARRRVERLLDDSAISDPTSLSDEKLTQAIDKLQIEEREISDQRKVVMDCHDRLQDEVKRRYKEKLST